MIALPPLLAGEWELAAERATGASAEVARARSSSGEMLALKIGHSADFARVLANELEALVVAASPPLPRARWGGWVVTERNVAKPASRATPGARPAIATDWIAGTSLLAPRALSEPLDVLLVAAEVAAALASLHAAGRSHGDISAANLMLGADGGVHLIDLGLSGSRHEREVRGGTPRYLARGDADLGTAASRDLFALGLVLAELSEPALRDATDLVAAARSATLPVEIGEICRALLAPRPGARPNASWVAARAEATRRRSEPTAAPGAEDNRMVMLDRAVVRSAYTHLRRGVLLHGGRAPAGAAPWLGELCAWANILRELDPRRADDASGTAGHSRLPVEEIPLTLLAPPDLVRWVVTLVGPSAAGWSHREIGEVGEAALASALDALASRARPAAWTYRDVAGALAAVAEGSREAPSASAPNEPAGTALVSLALAIASRPAPEAALLAVEADPDAPLPLVDAAARALTARGEIGRALALADRSAPRDAGGTALLAEIRRRAGDPEGARHAAEAARGASLARATLARLALDAGDARRALEVALPLDAAAVCEVASLAHAALGETEAALAAVDAGTALAGDAEARARLLGARAYVLAPFDPSAARKAFLSAVDEAARAGTTIEEATYLTGAAAASVDEGYLDTATVLGARAALLWEALGRPDFAVRALLARAAAFATARAAEEAKDAAHRALEAADIAGDRRAAVYAVLAAIDVATPEEAKRLIAAARERLSTLAGDTRADALHVFARALGAGLLPAEELARWDDAASDPDLPPAPRLEWWGARARADEEGRVRARRDQLVRALVTLGDVRAPVWARGPALAAGARLAATEGLGDSALRLRSALRRTSELLLERSGELRSRTEALPWLDRGSGEGAGTGLEREQVARLEQLVRSLASNTDLEELLKQVVDALVAWTGVERGLLLLRTPDGSLVPRAARNLAQRDLEGEQLALSRSLAGRALDAREPVVAVDAAGELPDVHRSVHALRLRSVLAVPLLARGEPLGVVYLDDRVRRGAFGERELAWVRTLASLAAGMIAAAMGEAQAERTVRRSERVRRVLERSLAEREVRVHVLEAELGKVARSRGLRAAFDGIIGESEPFVRALSMADRVANADIPVLLVGESGSGKELFARAIHDASGRRTAPFVSENCGAIPETLLESTLFGHVRGAFTGADRTRVGLFEAADSGTLFLDEVGEMSLAMQAKLLRILEEGIVRPLGTERTRKVDVRLIAATHRDLEAMVARKEFREDLYYRMSIVTVRLPPLRERRDDVPLLVKLFMDKHARGTDIDLSKEAMRRLIAFGWPGNVRQLENEVRRALVLGDGTIDVEHLSPEISRGARTEPEDVGLDVKRRVDQLETQLVREALSRTQGNQTKAAVLLGLSRFGLQKMIKRLAIKVP